jgi:hypothetical protein
MVLSNWLFDSHWALHTNKQNWRAPTLKFHMFHEILDVVLRLLRCWELICPLWHIVALFSPEANRGL